MQRRSKTKSAPTQHFSNLPNLKLEKIPGTYTVCRLDPSTVIPAWAQQGTFFSVTRTADELSIVCEKQFAPREVRAEGTWGALRVVGTLDFALTGIMASIADPLGAAKISLFAIATFDTDYILVSEDKMDAAAKALTQAGHQVIL